MQKGRYRVYRLRNCIWVGVLPGSSWRLPIWKTAKWKDDTLTGLAEKQEILPPRTFGTLLYIYYAGDVVDSPIILPCWICIGDADLLSKRKNVKVYLRSYVKGNVLLRVVTSVQSNAYMIGEMPPNCFRVANHHIWCCNLSAISVCWLTEKTAHFYWTLLTGSFFLLDTLHIFVLIGTP